MLLNMAMDIFGLGGLEPLSCYC